MVDGKNERQTCRSRPLKGTALHSTLDHAPYHVNRFDDVDYHKRTIGLRRQRLSLGLEAVLRAE